MVTFGCGSFEIELSFIKLQLTQSWGKEPHLKFSQQTVGPNGFSLERSGDFLLPSGFQFKGWFSQEVCEEHVPVCAAAPTRVVPPATGKYKSLTRQTPFSSDDHP